MTPRVPPQRVARSLDGLRRRYGIAPLGVIDHLGSTWTLAVGDDLAARSRPIELRNGELLVEVDDSATAQVVTWSHEAIAAAVRQAGGDDDVKRIRTRVVRGARR